MRIREAKAGSTLYSYSRKLQGLINPGHVILYLSRYGCPVSAMRRLRWDKLAAVLGRQGKYEQVEEMHRQISKIPSSQP